jgi:UDP-N-acetylglucosamine diphosphorylase/glucosamine-1-phosphate N-acetyltransferase
MNYILFDDDSRTDLLPLTFTRPVAEIRIGIFTICEKWERFLNTPCSFFTEDYLNTKYRLEASGDNILINGSILPDEQMVSAIKGLKAGNFLIKDKTVIAARLGNNFTKSFFHEFPGENKLVKYEHDIEKINFLWDIFSLNGKAFEADFRAITIGRKSSSLSKTNVILTPEMVFVEEGTKIECATLNASTGPIYIGKDAEIMEGSVIRGPFALCEHSVLKLGTKIYGSSTIGPYSKVGGEINNCVIFGYSNKSHDGFLGNSVLGEWCNIGAGSNNSNLKNNYSEIKLWNYKKESFIPTGLQFCGLIMGDHSKCGINTMFNTGTVVGVSANIFGAGYPRNFFPSFSWGGSQGMSEYHLEKAFEIAEKVFERRHLVFDDIEKNILKAVFKLTSKYRTF